MSYNVVGNQTQPMKLMKKDNKYISKITKSGREVRKVFHESKLAWHKPTITVRGDPLQFEQLHGRVHFKAYITNDSPWFHKYAKKMNDGKGLKIGYFLPGGQLGGPPRETQGSQWYTGFGLEKPGFEAYTEMFDYRGFSRVENGIVFLSRWNENLLNNGSAAIELSLRQVRYIRQFTDSNKLIEGGFLKRLVKYDIHRPNGTFPIRFELPARNTEQYSHTLPSGAVWNPKTKTYQFREVNLTKPGTYREIQRSNLIHHRIYDRSVFVPNTNGGIVTPPLQERDIVYDAIAEFNIQGNTDPNKREWSWWDYQLIKDRDIKSTDFVGMIWPNQIQYRIVTRANYHWHYELNRWSRSADPNGLMLGESGRELAWSNRTIVFNFNHRWNREIKIGNTSGVEWVSLLSINGNNNDVTININQPFTQHFTWDGGEDHVFVFLTVPGHNNRITVNLHADVRLTGGKTAFVLRNPDNQITINNGHRVLEANMKGQHDLDWREIRKYIGG